MTSEQHLLLHRQSRVTDDAATKMRVGLSLV